MGGLHPIDILILTVVIALSVFIIVLRVRRRTRAKSEIKGCGGECSSCSMSRSPNCLKNDSDKE